MSEYSEENKDGAVNYDDAGHQQTTETVRAMQGDDDGLSGPGLDVAAKIHLKLCSIDDKLDASFQTVQAKEQARLAAIPRRVSLQAGASQASFGKAFQVFIFGSPQTGRQWNIRNAIAVDVSSALAIGQAVLCVGPPAAPGMVDTTNGINTAGAAINVRGLLTITGNVAANTFNVGSAAVQAGEIAFLVVKPNAAADVVAASLIIEDEPVAALTEVVANE